MHLHMFLVSTLLKLNFEKLDVFIKCTKHVCCVSHVPRVPCPHHGCRILYPGLSQVHTSASPLKCQSAVFFFPKNFKTISNFSSQNTASVAWSILAKNLEACSLTQTSSLLKEFCRLSNRRLVFILPN